jgi:hypothetical protein
MSTNSNIPTGAIAGQGPVYSLLPAVFRTRDAQQGGQLEAFFSVLESQLEIVRRNVWQLYDDQFIETCAPWVIPYLGELIGFDPVYTVALTSSDSRAEVANTIGYRRRKGTLLALEQVTRDVSGRTTVAVEEFKRLITTLSLRDVRPRHEDTADIRDGKDVEALAGGEAGPFTRLNRTVDVRRIAPPLRVPGNSLPSQRFEFLYRGRLPLPAPANARVAGKDTTPLDITLHGGGRFNVPDVAVWMFRWQSWPVEKQPGFALGGGGWFVSPAGGPMPLFQQPPAPPVPFARLTNQGDAPVPITRWEFAARLGDFYPSSVELFEDGAAVDVSRIVCANLTELRGGGVCRVPAGKIAIDPELGRVQYAGNVKLPRELRVSYSYGSAAQLGGGSYDRTANVVPPAKARVMVVGGSAFPTLESAVAAWNGMPAGSAAEIVLPGFETLAVNLTGMHAIRLTSGCQLLIAAAELGKAGEAEWNKARVTLRGDVEVLGLPLPKGKDGTAAAQGQVVFNGIWLAGEMRVNGDAPCVQIADATLVPGRLRTAWGEAADPGEPSLSGTAVGASVCLNRVVTGPVALLASCTLRVLASVVDAGSAYCPAVAGVDPAESVVAGNVLASAGPQLHIEDSTVIGRVWVEAMTLASNTIFVARLGKRDPWKAAVWAQRVQTGCVRFCSLPFASIVPRRYECLPPDSSSEGALLPQFVSLRFGSAGYCLLSGDVPLAVWKGADNGSQMGVFQPAQETEAVTNIQIRSAEFLPANLERGVFLVPSRPVVEEVPVTGYGYRYRVARCTEAGELMDEDFGGIGVGLL